MPTNTHLNLDSSWQQVGFNSQTEAKPFRMMGTIYMKRELL